MTNEKHVCDHGCHRVSEIINQWPFGSDIDPDVLERKRTIGVNVHEAIDAYHNHIPPDLKAEEKGYFDSFLKWASSVPCEIIVNEKRYCDEGYKITGKVDLLAKFPHADERILVDFKTSASPSEKRWQMQAGLYYHILKKNGLNPAKRVIFLQLDKKGYKPKVFEYQITDKLLQVCAAAVQTFYFWKA